jgi:hypothetical protein
MKTKLIPGNWHIVLFNGAKIDYIYWLLHFETGVSKMYRIETTDPITGKSLTQLTNMPYVIENDNDDSLVIYFESEHNRDLYLKNPAEHRLERHK